MKGLTVLAVLVLALALALVAVSVYDKTRLRQFARECEHKAGVAVRTDYGYECMPRSVVIDVPGWR